MAKKFRGPELVKEIDEAAGQGHGRLCDSTRSRSCQQLVRC